MAELGQHRRSGFCSPARKARIPEDSFILEGLATSERVPEMPFDDEDGGADISGVRVPSGGFISGGTPKLDVGEGMPLTVTSDLSGVMLMLTDPPKEAKAGATSPPADAVPH